MVNALSNKVLPCVLISAFLDIVTGHTINITTGLIRGHQIEISGKTVSEFLGVPYAKPPLGSLRFSKPHPPDPWPGILDTTKPKAACMQVEKRSLDIPISEDCLFVNIWSPKVDGKPEKELKPVIFWIHGGFFAVGSINRDEHNGSALAAIGNVVVVSAAYRLDVFGFLYSGTVGAPGNIAWHDQNMALKWVKENIKHFGGDSSKVTIMGESAGSASVGVHIISKLSLDYFTRAIMQSGSTHKYEGLYKKKFTAEYALGRSKALAAAVGCASTDWLECLKKVEASKIMQWVKKNKSFNPIYIRSTDGFLPHDLTPSGAMTRGHVKKGFDLLIGTVANEGSFFLNTLLPTYFNRRKPIVIDKKHAQKFIKQLVNNSEVNQNAVAEFYTSNIEEEHRTELRIAVANSVGDFRVVCPVYFYAKKVALASKKNRVFFYKMSHKPRVSIRKDCVDWMGVCHGDDIIFTFGNPIRRPHLYTYEDYYFSLLVINIWSSFAKTGNPNPSSQFGNAPAASYPVNWPHFRSLSSPEGEVIPNYMNLDPKNFGRVVHYPYQSNCEGLWKKYFP